MKLSAICNREEYKDYYDIVFISKIIDEREWINLWNKVYKNSDAISWITAIINYKDLEFLKLKGNNILNKSEIEDRLEKIFININNYLNL